jgi:hypothetical protein
MRRVLRKIIAQQTDQLGDLSTLADPSVVDELIAKVTAALDSVSRASAKKARLEPGAS